MSIPRLVLRRNLSVNDDGRGFKPPLTANNFASEGKHGLAGMIKRVGLPVINSRFGSILKEMITHRFKLQDHKRIFTPTNQKHIRTVIEIEPWE